VGRRFTGTGFKIPKTTLFQEVIDLFVVFLA
jgi:hypothetical protein